MEMQEVKQQLQEVFQEIFDDDTLVISEETTAEDIEDWDSFAQIGLIMEIEKRFQLKFQLGEVSELKNVGDMLVLICKKIEGR
ncbi:MAG: acyl carrier protein [Eubacterium sp.]|nr:acyl carrier protein [Eubacterium sp.]